MREQSCCYPALSHFQFSPPGKFLCWRVREPPICSCRPVCYSSWKSDLAGGNNQNKPHKTRAKLGWDACNAKPCFQASLAFLEQPAPIPSPAGSPHPSSPAGRCAGLCPAFARALWGFILISFIPLISVSPLRVCPSLLPFVWRNGLGKGAAGGARPTLNVRE